MACSAIARADARHRVQPPGRAVRRGLPGARGSASWRRIATYSSFLAIWIGKSSWSPDGPYEETVADQAITLAAAAATDAVIHARR